MSRPNVASTRHSGRWVTLFALATAAAFASALSAPLVYDDVATIGRNESIRTLVPLSTPLTPPPLTSVTGRPVVNLSFALNYAINDALGVAQAPAAPSRYATTGYHVGNMLVHLLCGLLLFGVLRRTLRRVEWSGHALDADLLAGFATLIWLVHPIQTSAVDYVTARTELVVSMWILATLYAAIRGWDAASTPRRTGWYVVAAMACAAGMASKEVMVAAPLLVLLYDRAFRSPSWRAIWSDRGRLALHTALFLSALIVVQTVVANARSASVGFDLGVPWYEYFYSQGWVIGRYLQLLAWPRGLLFDYGARPIAGLAPLPGFVLLTAAAIGALVAWRTPRWRWLGFLGAWFFVILAPSSSILPVSTEIGAERRVYLASASVILLALIGADRLFARFAIRRRTAVTALGVIAVVLTIGSFVRGRAYATRTALYADTMAKAPRNPRAYFSAALAMFDADVPDRDGALALLRKAIEVDSTYFDPWHYMGVIALGSGRPRDAVEAFGRAEALRPGNNDANDGIARAWLQLGRPDSAALYAEKIGTYDVNLLWTLSGELLDRRQPHAAAHFLERAQSAQPTPMALALLAVAYAESGKPDDGLRAAADAVASAGDAATVYALSARAARGAQRSDLARAYVTRALQLDTASALAKQELEMLSRGGRR